MHDTSSSFRKSAELDIRTWDIPLPTEISATHSLQATSEGVYMPVQVVPLAGDPEQIHVDEGWVPPDYRECHQCKAKTELTERMIGRDAPEKTTVLALRYSRH
jgi:hypothetical protein